MLPDLNHAFLAKLFRSFNSDFQVNINPLYRSYELEYVLKMVRGRPLKRL